MTSFFKQYGAGFFTLIFLIQLCPHVQAQGRVTHYTYSETGDGAERPETTTHVTVTDNGADQFDCEDDEQCHDPQTAPQTITTEMYGESIDTQVLNVPTSENPHAVEVSVQLSGVPQNVPATNIIAAINGGVTDFEQFVDELIFIPSSAAIITADTQTLLISPFLHVMSVSVISGVSVTFNIAPGEHHNQHYTPEGTATINLNNMTVSMSGMTSTGVLSSFQPLEDSGGGEAINNGMQQLNIQSGGQVVVENGEVVEEAGALLDPDAIPDPNPVTGGVDVPDDEADNETDGNVQSRPGGAPRPDRSNESQQDQQQDEDDDIPTWDDSGLNDNHRRDDDDPPPPSAGSGNGPNTPGGGGTYDQGAGNGQSDSTGGNDGGNRGQGGGNQDSLGMLDLEMTVNNTRHFVWPDRNDNELNIKRSLWNQVIDQANSATVEGIK